jgi:hypothetical protein
LLFRARHNDPTRVLADDIDFFGGTSTGAIIATSLSWGMCVDEVEALYLEHGQEMFQYAPWYKRWYSKYQAKSLAKIFNQVFVEEDGSLPTLGSSRLKTMLMVVMRNATTGSPWPVTNNPDAKFNNRDLPGCNLDIPLWKLLRGSTAAPTYFTPEQIQFGERSFLFVDGGITPYNNPALLSVLMATLPSYEMNWATGSDQLHVISVGAGGTRDLLDNTRPEWLSLLQQVRVIPTAFMTSISDQQDMLCRVLGSCVHGQELDIELGDLMEPSLLPAGRQLFTYARYNRRLDVSENKGEPAPIPNAALDDLTLIPKLQELGSAYAEANVRDEHLDAAKS